MVADSLRKIPPQSDFFIENGVKDFSYIIEQKKYIVNNIYIIYNRNIINQL